MLNQKEPKLILVPFFTKPNSQIHPVVICINSPYLCIQFSSVAQSCLTLCNPMGCSTTGLPVRRQLPEFKLMSIELVMPSNHLILCRPLLLLPSIFPNNRVFSNESVLRIRWPKYWSFVLLTSNLWFAESSPIEQQLGSFQFLAIMNRIKSI